MWGLFIRSSVIDYIHNKMSTKPSKKKKHSFLFDNQLRMDYMNGTIFGVKMQLINMNRYDVPSRKWDTLMVHSQRELGNLGYYCKSLKFFL